jgi:hypothetical protein
MLTYLAKAAAPTRRAGDIGNGTMRSREERLGARVRRRGSCHGDSPIFRVRLR